MKDLLLNSTENKENFSVSELVERIIRMKIRMLNEHPFFGLLVQHLIFAVDDEIETACTDGERIYYSPSFCSKIDDDGLYYVTLHEVMHVVLGHCFRGVDAEHTLFNIACDIVVNSTIMGEYGFSEIDLGEDVGKLMHIAPNGEEGRHFTAEEVYEMLLKRAEKLKQRIKPDDGTYSNGQNGISQDGKITSQEQKRKARENRTDGPNRFDDNLDGFKDDHSKWGTFEKGSQESAIWRQRIKDAVEVMNKENFGWGKSSVLGSRVVKDLTPTLDWRVILNNFIQDEVIDYSFYIPDRRFQDSPFVLPSFSETDSAVKNVWVAVDASGSVSTRELSQAVSELKNAIYQFSSFEGYLSYFDSYVTRPIPFSSVEEINQIPSLGGGGTSFVEIFDYRRKNLKEMEISLIVIITDGYAPWPKEEFTDGIPVLWIINNNKVTPPWGVVARMI